MQVKGRQIVADSPATRKRKERARKAQHLIDVDAKVLKLVIFRSTQEDLAYLQEAGDFEQPEEVITLLIKNAAQILKRDMSQIDNLLKVPRHENKRRLL